MGRHSSNRTGYISQCSDVGIVRGKHISDAVARPAYDRAGRGRSLLRLPDRPERDNSTGSVEKLKGEFS
jgi:hypothetical protein